MRMTGLAAAAVAALFLAPALSPAVRAEADAPPPPATGEQIRSAVADHTMSGSMVETGAFTEYYAADGTVTGDGYTARWSIDGNQLCYSLGDASTECWEAGVDGNRIVFMRGDATLGEATLTPGKSIGQ